MADQSRLDVLEGRVEEQSRNWTWLRGEIGRLDQKIDHKTDRLRSELTARVDRLEQELEIRFNMLNDKIDRHFMWLVGIQVATLVASIGALVRR